MLVTLTNLTNTNAAAMRRLYPTTFRTAVRRGFIAGSGNRYQITREGAALLRELRAR